MEKKIKWCAIQPLTGGMYLGAEKALGCPAQFILSYPGFGDEHYDKKTNELIYAGNEYSLMKYLDKVGRRPEYKVFNRKPFQNDTDMHPEILSTQWTLNGDKELDYSNMDVCVAVPVCSGLSTATIGTSEAKEARNCNMLWISTYALNMIKPKVYIFENAPTFMGERGGYIRERLEKLAKENGYSIVYYKTDTQYHDNCQKRKRTFIIFFKKNYAPSMDFERIETDYDEYLSRIPKDASSQEPLQYDIVNYINMCCVKYLKNELGENWREIVNYDLFKYIIDNNLLDDILDYVMNDETATANQKHQIQHFVDHVQYKISLGKGFYHPIPHIPHNGKFPAVMFKMVQSCLHPHEDRLLSTRELLHLMGHPHDFELYGIHEREYAKIGQNVPVRTAYWIVSEAMRAYERDNDLEEKKQVRFFDNTKEKEMEYAA